ncbi:3-deoxy-manno-octulosonate cytidylyltransferase [Cryobacterium sp. AP23]
MQSSEHGLHVVIPARFGSHRLPGKPLVDLGGKPMIVRVLEAVQHSLGEVDVVVAVDDERVAMVLEKHGASVAMTSPLCESGTDRVAEVARERGWAMDDLVINVQGDEPLIPGDLLLAFAEFCRTREGFSMGTVSVPIADRAEILDPNVVKVMVREDESAITFSRAVIPFDRDRQFEAMDPTTHRRHLGIYAYRNDVLQTLTSAPPCQYERIERLEQLRALWLGIPIHVMAWHSAPPGGIDTDEDVERVRAYLERSLR